MPQRGGALLNYGFKLFVCKSQLNFIFAQGFLRQYAFGYALAQCFLSLLALGNIVEAVDRSCDFSSVVLQWSNIHDDDNPRAIGPLNMHFRIMHPRHLAGQHVAHRTLLVWHKATVWAVQLERAAEPFVC